MRRARNEESQVGNLKLHESVDLGEMYQFGCVPYVNARPLTAGLPPGSIVYEVPSGLPAMLDSGAVDTILVSSIELIRRPELVPVGNCGIVSTGAVESVRLFSTVPLPKVRTLALDESSMTSNCLAQIVLAEAYSVHPETQVMAPDLNSMLGACDACVLIGDIGMTAAGDGLYVSDLGLEWTHLTGLPFVWARWLSLRPDPELTSILDASLELSGFGRDRSIERMSVVVDSACMASGWTPEVTRRYLAETMSYPIGKKEQAGFAAFADRVRRGEKNFREQAGTFLGSPGM